MVLASNSTRVVLVMIVFVSIITIFLSTESIRSLQLSSSSTTNAAGNDATADGIVTAKLLTQLQEQLQWLQQLQGDQKEVSFSSSPIMNQDEANDPSNGDASADKNKNWPSNAVEEVGSPLITKGSSFVTTQNIRSMLFDDDTTTQSTTTTTTTTTTMTNLMKEFLEIYKNRPDKINLCGIRINHALGLFLTVRHLNPSLVIESGVNAGQSTYIIRAASPTTKIWALDPLDKPICEQGDRWVDEANPELTTYFTGSNFIDLGDFDYIGMIQQGEINVDKTLVFIDDHLDLLRRLVPFYKAGLRHILVEDNYKMGEGATPGDKHGTPKHVLSAPSNHERRQDGEWLLNNLMAYAEFPPLVPSIMAKENNVARKKAGGFMVASDTNHDIVEPILRPDLNEGDEEVYVEIAKELGHDARMKDNESYMQFMNYNNFLYMELLPMAPDLVQEFSKPVVGGGGEK